MKRSLLVMAKRPFPGRTKTRLSPSFSQEEAAALYECFLQDTLEIARSVPGVSPFVAFAPATEEAYFRQLAPRFELVPQEGCSLSERLDYVMCYCSKEKFSQVVAISSDCPTLPVSYVTKAFSHLDDNTVDVVLGPCEDGGYYLIGWKRPNRRLIREVQMSTPYVLQETVSIAREEHLEVALLPIWYDVDGVEDLDRVEASLIGSPEVGRYTRQFLQRKAAKRQNHILPILDIERTGDDL